MVEVGKTYRSRAFASITREVTHISDSGIVTYNIKNSRWPDDPMFNYENRTVIEEFERICAMEVG